MTDTERLLIAASLDGELTPEESRRLRSLLDVSEPARRLLQELTDQRIRLASMPRRQAPTSLRANVERKLPVPRKFRKEPSFLPHLIAASLLLAIAAGTFHFSRDRSEPRSAERTVEMEQLRVLPKDGPTSERAFARSQVRPAEAPELQVAPAPRLFVPAIAKEIEIAPPPRVAGARVLGFAPVTGDESVSPYTARLPLLFAVNDADKPEVLVKLRQELDASMIRVDLFAPEPLAALETMAKSAMESGWAYAIDSALYQQLQQKGRVEIALYTEDLNPDEVEQWLMALAKINRKEGRKVFGQAHLVAAKPADQTLIRTLYGLDAGKRLESRPKNREAPDRRGIMTLLTPAAQRTAVEKSREIGSFVERRKATTPRAKSVPLLIVIRS